MTNGRCHRRVGMANSPNKIGSALALRCPPRIVSIRDPRAGFATSGQTFARCGHGGTGAADAVS
jgi:hypothetical protein